MNVPKALLPPELWSKVFIHAVLPDRPEEEFEHWPSPYCAHRYNSLKLATVCLGWRKMAYACPDIWTSLPYSITGHSVANGGLVGVQAWLARSGTRPLALHFACCCQDPLILNAFLQVFYSHFSRLAVLHVRMGGGIFGDILPVPRVDMPWCSLVNTNFSGERYVAWFAPFFLNRLPALRTLKMREYIASTVSHMPVEHHISNLTHLNAVANNFKMRPVDVLRGCPRLIVCRLYFRLSDNDDSNGMRDDTACDPFTLAHLRTLWIRVKVSYNWRDVFAHATFPALEDMTLIGSMWPVPTFAPFLERSRCPLRRLSLGGSNASVTALIAVFDAVNGSLETFHYSEPYPSWTNGPAVVLDDTFLDALDPWRQNVLVPRLHSLEISTLGVLKTTEGRLLDVVRARMSSARTVPLQNICLSCCSSESERPSFHKLDFEGLESLGHQYPELRISVYPNLFSRREGGVGSDTDHKSFLAKTFRTVGNIFLCRAQCGG